MRLLLALVFVALSYSYSSAQTTVSVNINTATLQWDWAVGPAPNDGAPDEFLVKCGNASKVYTKITSVSPTVRSLAVRTAIQGSGSWYCVVTARNSFAESGPSNEIFFAAGAPPSNPTNHRVVAQ